MGTSKGYIPPKNDNWKKAKASITRMVNTEDKKEGIKKAISEYSNAYLNTHINSANIGKITGNIIGFLLDAKENGLDKALENQGLSNLLGKSSEEVYLGVIDYFCENNTTIEESVIRECAIDIFDDKQIIDFEDLSKVDIKEFLTEFIIKYIQINFEVSFTEKIQGLCNDIESSKKLINDVNDYIHDNIRNLYDIGELLEINWRSQQGEEFIKHKCSECYELMKSLQEV